MVSGSGSADSVEKFGPCGTMALPVLGSAEEVNGAAEEEDHAGEVGFGFGDGYDFGAAAGEAPFKPAANQGGARVAIEADVGKIVSKGGIVGEDEVAGGLVIINLIPVSGGSAPVPDGQGGPRCPRSDAAEAEGADEAGEVDGRVGTEGEGADGFIEGSIHSQSAAITEGNVCVVVDGIGDCDEEGTAVDIDA